MGEGQGGTTIDRKPIKDKSNFCENFNRLATVL